MANDRITINGVEREIDSEWITINGVWRKVDKTFETVNGVHREAYTSYTSPEFWAYIHCKARNDTHGLFGPGGKLPTSYVSYDEMGHTSRQVNYNTSDNTTYTSGVVKGIIPPNYVQEARANGMNALYVSISFNPRNTDARTHGYVYCGGGGGSVSMYDGNRTGYARLGSGNVEIEANIYGSGDSSWGEDLFHVEYSSHSDGSRFSEARIEVHCYFCAI